MCREDVWSLENGEWRMENGDRVVNTINGSMIL